jgi:hypothetical protein
MRIKIIGDNNCARATRHLLRTAGFAVSEFLPADVVTAAPHSGYVITIELAPAPHLRDGEAARDEPVHGEPVPGETPDPSLTPGYSTHGQPAAAIGEALSSLDGVSSPSFAEATAGKPASTDSEASLSVGARHAVPLQPAEHDLPGLHGGAPTVGAGLHVEESESCRSFRCQDERDAGATHSACIHFDSVEGDLERAILRHVAALSAEAVVVDRPGGVVRSERELRIIVPTSGDARADEAAAVAVEFGVLRGLLDLVSPAPPADWAGQSAAASGRSRSLSERKKWWKYFSRATGSWWRRHLAGGLSGLQHFAKPYLLSGRHNLAKPPAGRRRHSTSVAWSGGLLAGALFALAGNLYAGPGRAALELTHVVEARGAEGAYLHLAALPPPAQGQFFTGQQTKITDGTNTLVVDPCKAQTKLYVSINQTGNTQLVAGTASKKIYICSIHVVVATAANVALVEGTGSVCGTGTAGVSGFGGATAATGWNFAANGGIALGNGDAALGAEGTSADNLCLFNSGSGQVSGGISYVVE